MLKTHRITRGTTADLLCPLLLGGVEQPVDGWTFIFTVVIAPASAGVEPVVITKSTANGGIVEHNATNVRVLFAPADSESLGLGRYRYYHQGRSPSGRIEALESGYLYIDADTPVDL